MSRWTPGRSWLAHVVGTRERRTPRELIRQVRTRVHGRIERFAVASLTRKEVRYWSFLVRREGTMTNYVIIAPPKSTLTDAIIRSKFTDRNITISSGVAWAVSSNFLTCSDVRDHIRSPRAEGRTCVVVKATEYNGYAQRDIWEKMEAWERER